MPSTSKQRGLARIMICFVLMTSLATRLALAQTDERALVRLTLDACPTLARDRVRNILGAELGALLIAQDRDQETPAIDVVVECIEADTTLTVRDPVTGTALVRHVALDTVHPLARERLVALAIAELVTAIGIEVDGAPPEPEPEPPPEPVVEPEPVVVIEAPSEPEHPRFKLAALGTTSLLGHPRRGAYGGRVRFDHQPHRLFGWATGLSLERSRIGTELGRVTVSELALDLEATVNLRFRFLSLQGAVGGAIGMAVLRGKANDDMIREGSFRALFVSPHLAIRAFIQPTRGFFIVVGTELAVITASAHALVDGMRVVNLEGVAFTGQLGLGFEL